LAVNGGVEPRELMKIEHALADLVMLGCPLRRAATELGLEHGRIESWLHRGRSGSPGYRRLADSIEAAECEREQNLREAIRLARERLAASRE
jgi:hypothetical protein